MPPLRSLLREPLLHFVLIGAALFALERAVRREPPPRAQDPRIVVGADVRASLAETWSATHGQAPSPADLDTLVAQWIDDEVLYREGLARGLDRDDPRVRDRVASKMAHVVKAEVVVPEPAEADLRAWFDGHRERWAKTDLFDFVQVFVLGDDEAARARATDLLAKLQAGADPAGLGDTFSGGRHYRRRKLDDLARSFGDEFVTGMAEQTPGTWALRRSRFGLHLIRIERQTPAEVPELAAVLPDVRKDWEDARRADGYAAAMRTLRARWEIVRAP